MATYNIVLARGVEDQLAQIDQTTANDGVRRAISALGTEPMPDEAKGKRDRVLASLAIHPAGYCIGYQVMSQPRPTVLIDFISAMRDEEPHCACEAKTRRRRWRS